LESVIEENGLMEASWTVMVALRAALALGRITALRNQALVTTK
jgi:Arc/MetJ family transcription regulator